MTEVDGAPAIVMEFVEGKSLEEILLDGGHSEELMTKVAVSVLSALSYAHGKGVVHRDIKPGNILVSQSGIIKVTDFGLAAVSNAPLLTMEGSLIGTPAYMSPEQARGEVVDARTDLFSLGITLIETLTTERILLGNSYAECINRIQNFQLQSIERFSDKFPTPMFEFLKRLLAPDKGKRFSSAEEALKSLALFAGEGKDLKINPNVAVKKKKTRLVLAAVLAILVLGSLFVYLVINSMERNVNAVSVNAVDTSTRQITEAKPPESEKREDRNGPGLMRKVDPLGKPSFSRVVSLSDAKKTGGGMVSTDSGYISITCNPWAEVNIDSEYVGRTPIAGSIKVPSGEHSLTFTNPIFVPIVKEVEVEPKNLSTVDADFLKDAGYVFVTVGPWGDIYIDDLKRDTTPLSKPIIVSAGVRKLRIHNPAFQDIIKNLKVVPGDTLRLNFNFQAKTQN